MYTSKNHWELYNSEADASARHNELSVVIFASPLIKLQSLCTVTLDKSLSNCYFISQVPYPVYVYMIFYIFQSPILLLIYITFHSILSLYLFVSTFSPMLRIGHSRHKKRTFEAIIWMKVIFPQLYGILNKSGFLQNYPDKIVFVSTTNKPSFCVVFPSPGNEYIAILQLFSSFTLEFTKSATSWSL